jgi:hypothetical protein
MANFKEVNQAIKNKFPALDIEVVRGVGYFYFDGEDGYDKLDSVMSHPVSTSTDDVIMLATREIEDSYQD